MSVKLRCYTLFDITKTNIPNRRASNSLPADELKEWEKRRNTQTNFDTILQIISLRSQPEDITDVTSSIVDFTSFDNFGFLYESEEPQKCWTFEFTIFHSSVFDDGISELGALYSDCEGVPMIKVGTEWDKLQSELDISPELRNIYFEVLHNE